ncbi:MAG: 4-hydroxy-tetrahydrodipicolinate reductase [Deltaproteobacteria bacterium]|nr:4-hydroxy-tetrahydrodipicolinate reductase [bacterium]MCB9479261.1 4-hydroxy-tetrahydrodipicolinate reductase [Deltaproteobacteria bacterium]MCB9490340.1 4-hydroxy-tetrahydrodipicolinate reductase [Deltaproteobacteria bacterium]
MVKAVVTGGMGRMGQMFVRHLVDNPKTLVYGAVERPDHPHIGEDIGTLVLGRPIDAAIADDLLDVVIGANAVIDFTTPENSIACAKVCADRKIPYVCGTTGMDDAQKEKFLDIARETATMFAPNFSVGVNVLLGLARKAAFALGESFDIEIVEAHHRHKIDAPSGTALALAEAVRQGRGLSEDDYCFGRKGQVGERYEKEIGIHAVRGGDVVGEHEVHFLGDSEAVMLRHRASSREAFVRGAVRAAAWLQGKPAGLYTMADMLDL